MTAPFASPPTDPVTAMAGQFERFGIAALRLAMPIATTGPDGSAPPPIQSSFRVGSHRWRLVLQPEDGAFRIAVSTDCGVIPYTAGGCGGPRRPAGGRCPELGGLPLARIVVTADQRLRVVGDWQAEGAMTPHAVIYELIRFLREARPIADLLSSLQAR